MTSRSLRGAAQQLLQERRLAQLSEDNAFVDVRAVLLQQPTGGPGASGPTASSPSSSSSYAGAMASGVGVHSSHADSDDVFLDREVTQGLYTASTARAAGYHRRHGGRHRGATAATGGAPATSGGGGGQGMGSAVGTSGGVLDAAAISKLRVTLSAALSEQHANYLAAEREAWAVDSSSSDNSGSTSSSSPSSSASSATSSPGASSRSPSRVSSVAVPLSSALKQGEGARKKAGAEKDQGTRSTAHHSEDDISTPVSAKGGGGRRAVKRPARKKTNDSTPPPLSVPPPPQPEPDPTTHGEGAGGRRGASHAAQKKRTTKHASRRKKRKHPRKETRDEAVTCSAQPRLLTRGEHRLWSWRDVPSLEREAQEEARILHHWLEETDCGPTSSSSSPGVPVSLSPSVLTFFSRCPSFLACTAGPAVRAAADGREGVVGLHTDRNVYASTSEDGVSGARDLHLCSVCLLPAAYRCLRCGTALFCSIDCHVVHDATRCMKFIV